MRKINDAEYIASMEEIIKGTLQFPYVKSLDNNTIHTVVQYEAQVAYPKQQFHVSIGNRFTEHSNLGDTDCMLVFIDGKDSESSVCLLISGYEIFQLQTPVEPENIKSKQFFSEEQLLHMQRHLFNRFKGYQTNWKRFHTAKENIKFVNAVNQIEDNEEYQQLEKEHDEKINQIFRQLAFSSDPSKPTLAL